MKKNIPDYLIREAKQKDVEVLLDLVKKLAEYEKLLPDVKASPELFRQNGFGDVAYFNALLVENQNESGPRFLGFALYFFTFSTFLGKPTLYLEDLFVLPEFRGGGIGKALLKTLVQIALEKECGRMEWSVLNWNESAIKFYMDIKAIPMDEWTVYRITIPEMEALLDLSED
jgi:GNAT superfamily N-acetyltransferase